MLVQIIQVERSKKRIWRGKQTCCSDGCSEVCANVHAGCQAGDEVGNGEVLAIAVDEAMICQRIETRTRATSC